MTTPSDNAAGDTAPEGVQLSAATFYADSYDIHKDLRERAEKADKGGDTFSIQGAANKQNTVIRPPYDFGTLTDFADDSPTLDPCISAMEINVESTGHEIVPREGVFDPAYDYEKDDPDYKRIVNLFAEPYPNTTMIGLRRKLRRDLERTGNGYIECLDTANGMPAFLKQLRAKYVRALEFTSDDKTLAEIRIGEGSDARVVKLERYERRYLYKKGNVTRYLAASGATRDLNAVTGEWATKGNRLKAKDRAPTLLHFTVKDDDTSGVYGLPRWLSNVRSVAGEVEAEALNLSFFKNGGIPPLMIFLQNGTISAGSRTNLEQALSGTAASKQRGVVVETVATGGSLDKAGDVKVTVERFGSDRQKDSMFNTYMNDCYIRVKSSYRIPQLFLGRTDDYNYATAYAALVIGEAQVFKPERDEFDALISNAIVRRMSPNYVFKSKPLVAVDVEIQKSVLELVSNAGAISREELVRVANNLSNLSLEWNGTEPTNVPDEIVTALARASAVSNTTGSQATTDDADTDGTTNATKSENVLGVDLGRVESLAGSWANLLTGTGELKQEDVAGLQAELTTLSVMEANVLSWRLAELMLPEGADLNEGMVALNQAAAALQLQPTN
ncbi:gene transfer agent portal protein [Vibrio phage LV6]|nr:gene transfer agent portal protein [Vibrio phage LV6]